VKLRVQELSPIEVALDEMQMRVTELEEVVFMKPTDAKKLQLRLQVGTERVQVRLLFVQNRDWTADRTSKELWPDSWPRQELFCLSLCPYRLWGPTLGAAFPGNKAAAAGS